MIPAVDHAAMSGRRDALLAFCVIVAVLGAAATIAVAGLAAGPKLLAVVAGAIAFIAAAIACGNPRLFLLWVLILTLPMALSKYFGEILYKGGGEQSFRIELYDAFVYMLFVLQLRDAAIGRTRGIRLPKAIYPWLAIMVLGVIYVALGPWRTSAAHELVRMFKVMMLFIVLVNELSTPRRMLACITPLALGIVLQACVGIAQYGKGDLLGLEMLGETTAHTMETLSFTSVQGERAFRPSGLLLHANILGIYCATVLPVLLATVVILRGFWLRAALAVACALGAIAMLLAQSRAAWVGFALAMLTMWGFMLSHRRILPRIVAPLLVMASGFALALLVFADKILRRLFESKADATVGREVFLNDFHRLIADHWLFGVGLNTYTNEIVPYLSFSVGVYDGWIPPVHNIYYLWWAETGVPGLFLYMLTWAMIVWTGVRNLVVRDDLLYALNVACLASMVAFAFDGFLNFSLRVNQPQRIYFFLAAIIYAIHYWRQSGIAQRRGLPA